MTIQEILQKVDNKTAAKKDLFEYYGVKNEEALQFAFEEKFKEPKLNGDYLNSTFEFIYEVRQKEKYNPIEEAYVYYAMILKALYDLDSDELKVIASILGAFKTVMLLEKILINKEEVVFFEKMYKKYLEKTENIYIKLNQILGSVNKLINDFDPKQLEKFSMELQSAINGLDIK
jgi:hypothetical protein